MFSTPNGNSPILNARRKILRRRMKQRLGRPAARLVSNSVLLVVVVASLPIAPASADLIDTAALAADRAAPDQATSNGRDLGVVVPAATAHRTSASPAGLTGFVGTKDAIPSASGPPMRDRVITALEREDMRDQLAAYGITPEEARARVDALTDSEIAALSGALDDAPAGAGTEASRSLVDYVARTIAAVLFLPFEIIFSVFGVPHQSPLDPEGA